MITYVYVCTIVYGVATDSLVAQNLGAAPAPAQEAPRFDFSKYDSKTLWAISKAVHKAIEDKM